MLLHAVLWSLLVPCLGVDLTYAVSDGTTSGIYLGNIAADAGVMSSLRYKEASLFRFIQLTPELTNSSQLFRVTKKTGSLYTALEIDAETVCKIHTECYKVINIAVHQQTSFVKLLEVKINIKDVNDHVPEFPFANVSIEFSERDIKGTQLVIPSAVDKDISINNSRIRYVLQKGKDVPFTLNVLERVNGKAKLLIRLEESLDREVTDSYSVQVIARDMGSPSKESVLNVKIIVGDENDNQPIFSQTVYNISIGKSHNRSKSIIALTATDFDSGENGEVKYQFSFDTSNVTKKQFVLNKETGEIFLSQDFAPISKGQFRLYVEAEDNGNPPLSSIALVLVDVAGKENHPPNIDVNVLSEGEGGGVGISEDADVGSFVGYLKITDFDEGQDAEVVCVLHHTKFQLEQIGTKRYKIVLKNHLDREEEDVHDLIIECSDQGTPSLSSEKRFSIQVLDVNDERPEFATETFKFVVDENEKSGSSVGFINVSDSDLGIGGQMSLSLLTSNEGFLPFKISQDGLITTSASLDREFQSEYKFQVFVKDHGTPSFNNMADVIVELKDRNDNAPYFTFPRESPLIMNVIWYPPITKNITHLRAADDDVQANALLRYRIMKGNTRELFGIGHYTGLLSFNRAADKYDAGNYELEIVVKDSGFPVLSARTSVFLILSISDRSLEEARNPNGTGIMIHLNFAIVIVVVSVTLAISAVLILTICYIRYSDNRITTLKHLNMLISENENLAGTDTLSFETVVGNSAGVSTTETIMDATYVK